MVAPQIRKHISQVGDRQIYKLLEPLAKVGTCDDLLNDIVTKHIVEPMFDFSSAARPAQFDAYMLTMGKHIYKRSAKTDSEFAIDITPNFYTPCTFRPYEAYERYLIANLDRIREDLQYDPLVVMQILKTCLYNIDNDTLPPKLFEWLNDVVWDLEREETAGSVAVTKNRIQMVRYLLNSLKNPKSDTLTQNLKSQE